ncbi:secreted RxLR effector peptide protein, putative [Phytophthora infestans T30-4]|uniref:Secreted RxLR effector peptide protein n=2 Tax=Phytophthora infestans TaxID=4787 RepID=A0A833W5Q4_PHYIN
MRFQVFAVLVFVALASSLGVAERGVEDVNTKGFFRKRSRKLTADEDWLPSAEKEERGFSLASPSRLVSKLKAKTSTVNFAGAKTGKLSNTQIKTVSREVAKEVNKNPKAWPTIKTGLKILFGTALFALIAAGVYAMIHSMRNYT